MANNLKPQNPSNVFQHQSHPSNRPRPPGGVRQDKRAFLRARTASHQPASIKNDMRAQAIATKNIRSRNRNEQKRQTVQLTLWVKPIVKSELGRIAEQEGLSISATGGAFLEKALQEHIDMQYGALLEPIIRQEIRSQMRAYSTRIALLLVRTAFASEQTRNLVTNILARQPGVKPEILDHILDSSSSAAKSKIIAKTPQLESIIAEVEQWFTEKRENEK